MEDHAKGTLHFHLLLYGGISSNVLQDYAGVPDIVSAIADVLDSQYQSKFPAQTLLQQIVKESVRGKVPNNRNLDCTKSALLESDDLIEHYTGNQ